MYDWRRHERTKCREQIELSVNVLRSNRLEKMIVNAETVDISKGGLGVVTSCRVELGFVRLSGIPEHESGIVVWSRKIDERRCRAGIRFVHSFTRLMRRSSGEDDAESVLIEGETARS